MIKQFTLWHTRLTTVVFLFTAVGLLPLQSLAQTFSGTLTISNWRPNSGRGTAQTGAAAARGPLVSAMNVRWSFTPKGDLLTETFNTQWYLGNAYLYQGKEVPMTLLEGAENKLSIVSVMMDADIYAGGIKITRVLIDLGVTPPHGGTWGQNVTREIPWEQLFSKAGIGPDSAKVLYARKIELKDATIKAITFGGLDQVDAQVAEILKQQQHQEAVAQGDQAMAANEFVRAASLYEQALQLYITPPVQEKLAQARYSHYMQQGDLAMSQRNYPFAVQQFQLAAGINATPMVQERLLMARFSIPMTQGELAMANRDFPAAINFFEEASRIAPRPEAIERLNSARYQLFMARGDALARDGRFGDAIVEYEAAGRLFPAETAPRDAIARAQTAIAQNNAFNEMLPALTRQYQEKVAELEGKQTTARAQAIDALQQANEACHLENLAFFTCELNFYRQKLALVREEAEFKAYGTPRKTPVAEQSNCQPTDCQVSMTVNMAKPLTSAQNLEAAKRKLAVFAQIKDEAFRKRAKDLTDLALQQNSRNAAALAFSSEFADDPLQKMTLIRQAEQIEPRNPEVMQAKAAVMPGFAQALSGNIANGNAVWVSSAVQAGLIGADLRIEGQTPLQYAVKTNQTGVLEALLGSRPSRDELQRLVFQAAEQNSAASLATLLNRGATPSAMNGNRETPLVVAARSQANDAIAVLMQAPGAAASAGTALLAAVEAGHVATAKTFLDQQADANVRNADGLGLASIAADHRDVEMLRMLIGYRIDLDQTDNLQRTPLAHAAAVRSAEIIELLISKEIDLVKAFSLLQKQSMADLQYLVEVVFSVSFQQRNMLRMEQCQRNHNTLALQRAPSGKTWFGEALATNRPEVCDLLLASAFDANQPLDGELPLATACEKKMPLVVQGLLTRKGANPNQLTTGGANALHIAVRNGFAEGVTLLLAQGAMANMVDAQGFSPLYTALDRNFTDIAAQLLTANADVRFTAKNGQQPLHLAVIKRQQGLAERMLGMGAEVNAAGADRMTPLHYAAQSGDAAMCTMLVSKGASLTAIDAFKRTPAKVASQAKFKALAKQLKAK